MLLGGDLALEKYPKLWERASRVQLNVHSLVQVSWPKRMFLQMRSLPHIQWIFQMDGTSNEEFFFKALEEGIQVAPLFDKSAGAGLLPGVWPRAQFQEYGKLIYHGYAGGLGPDNLQTQLPLILEASLIAPFWIDMEGQIRTNGILDLVKVERVLEICKKWMEEGSKG